MGGASFQGGLEQKDIYCICNGEGDIMTRKTGQTDLVLEMNILKMRLTHFETERKNIIPG